MEIVLGDVGEELSKIIQVLLHVLFKAFFDSSIVDLNEKDRMVIGLLFNKTLLLLHGHDDFLNELHRSVSFNLLLDLLPQVLVTDLLLILVEVTFADEILLP